MKRDTAIATLKAHEVELKEFGVRHLYLFGSIVRGDAPDYSDVDLFSDFERGELTLFGLTEVKKKGARITGHKTDIITETASIRCCARGLKPPCCRSFDD